MLKFFKRSSPTTDGTAVPEVPPDPVALKARWSQFFDPLPLPEVVEGNNDADWALWADSISFQEQQVSPSATQSKNA
jgi:hypothetical protein